MYTSKLKQNFLIIFLIWSYFVLLKNNGLQKKKIAASLSYAREIYNGIMIIEGRPTWRSISTMRFFTIDIITTIQLNVTMPFMYKLSRVFFFFFNSLRRGISAISLYLKIPESLQYLVAQNGFFFLNVLLFVELNFNCLYDSQRTHISRSRIKVIHPMS